jgi:hypothetical protein
MKITKSELSQIIKEEAQRFVTIQKLKAEKAEIEKVLNESYLEEEDELGEGFLDVFKGPFGKAKKEFKEQNAGDIATMKVAYEKYNVEKYSELTKKLKEKVMTSFATIGKKHGITGSDLSVFRKELMDMVEPMDLDTFKKQAEKGGYSMADVAFGSGAGQRGYTTGKKNESFESLSESDIRRIAREESLKATKIQNLQERAGRISRELKNL